MRKFRGEIEKFSGGGMRNFRGRGLSREGLNFFGRGDIFSEGVGNFLGAGFRFFGCGWELFGRPVDIFSGGVDIFSRGVAIFLGGVEIFSGGDEIFQKG